MPFSAFFMQKKTEQYGNILLIYIDRGGKYEK